MLKLFKSTNPLIAILYPLTAAVFVIFLPGTTSEQSEINGYPFLYKLLIKLISGNFFSFTYGFLSILFFTADGIFYNYIIRKLRIVKSYRNLHGFIFMFLTGSILRFTSPLQTLAAIFFFLLSIFLVMKTLRKDFAVFDFFNAGLALAVSSFFIFKFIYLYPVILTGILIFRSLDIREISASLTGIFVPYFILISIYFFIFSDFKIILEIYNNIFFKHEEIIFKTKDIVCGSIFFVITAISTLYIFSKYKTSESDIQDYYSFHLFMFLIAFTVFILTDKNDFGFFSVFFIPASLPSGVFLSDNSNQKLKEILFDVFLTAVIVSQINFY